MSPEELAQLIREVLENKNARDVDVLKINEKTVLADYFVIASGSSTTQIRSLTDEVEFQVEETAQRRPNHIEGAETNRWVLLDYGDVVVHLFMEEERTFYSLERLWEAQKPLPQ